MNVRSVRGTITCTVKIATNSVLNTVIDLL